MNIILVGAGRIGYALAHSLTLEGHDITVIDRDEEQIAHVSATLDVMTVCGSVDIELLRLAGVERQTFSSPSQTPTRPTFSAAGWAKSWAFPTPSPASARRSITRKSSFCGRNWAFP